MLFINSVFSYKLNLIKNISFKNNNNLISRRKLFTLSPLVISLSLIKFIAYGKIIKFKLLQENNPPDPLQEDKNYLDRINNLGKNPWSWFNWYAVQRIYALKETITAAEKYNID